MIYINKNISINEKNIIYKTIRSSGPGGQHINKVSTGIHLKYNINKSFYPDWFIEKLKKTSGSLLSNSGIITIKANSYRSQTRNKEDAIKRLIKLFKLSSLKRKYRIKTQPPLSFHKKRIKLKKIKSSKKQLRNKPSLDD